MMTRKVHIRSWLAAGIGLAVLGAPGAARAQYQVAEPGAPGPNAPAATTQAWDRRPGVELYGNNTNKPPRYGPHVSPLPSETRMAIERSGALPSEIRMQSEAVGPLSPNGPIDYVPALSPLQRAMGMTPPVLWGPAWERPAAPATADGQRSPLPLPAPGTNRGAAAAAAAGERSPLDVTPGPIVQQPWDGRIQPGPLGPANKIDSIVTRPLRRTRGPATTQPTTAPSLSDQHSWAPRPDSAPPAAPPPPK